MLGWLKSIGGFVDEILYNARGQKKEIDYANGTVSAFNYFDQSADPLKNFALKIRTTTGPVSPQDPSGILQNLPYTYDNVGNVASITDSQHTGGRTFGYDDLNRLTSGSGTFGGSNQSQTSCSYAYDAIGNLLNKCGVAYAYNDSMHPSFVTARDDGKSYTADINGNTQSGDGRTFVWTADNRVFSVNNSSGTTSMDYDYTGARVKKYGPLGQVLYPFAGYEIGPDLTKTKYFRVGNEIVGSKQTPVVNPEKKFFYHADHLGGTNIITDITGLRVQLTEYDPWGKVSRNDGTVDPEKRFTGQILDPESGLYYYGARYYDPELGRFISPDPIVPSPGDPQSLNRYSYVRNNPVKYIDPTGHSFWSAIGNFFKNLFRRPEIFFATLIVGLVTGGAAYLATGSWIIAGAVAGAFAGLTGAGMSGGNLWQGMLIGMVGGAVGGGVYGAVGGGLEGVLAGAFTGGFVSGGLGTAFNGGNFFQNAMVGAIGSTVVAAAVYGVAKGAAWLSEKWNSMPGTPEAQQATLKSAAGLQFAGNTKQIGDPTTMSDACSAVCGEEKPLTVDKQQGAAQGTGSNNPTWANKFFRAVAAMATVGILDTAEALIMGGLRIAATGGPVGMVVGIPVAVLGVGIGVGGLIFGANSLDLQGTLGLPDLNFPKDHP